MFKKALFGNLCLIAALHAADHQEEIGTQAQFSKHCVQVSKEVYKSINENVEFSDVVTTNSQFWETRTVLAKSFLVKLRGIPLSEALNDLINGNSVSSFECTVAHCITIWKILIPFQMDRIIANIEMIHEDFFFPLMMPATLNAHRKYAQYYGFFIRNESFNVGKTPVNTKVEWEQIVRLEGWLDKLPMDSAFKSFPTQKALPYRTSEGGIVYLPNVEGVKGVGKGENLFCVDGKEGLYYGFGPLFKSGPKKLFDIALDLETYALKNQRDLYLKETAQRTKELGNNKKNGCHILEYFIDSNACLYLSLRAVREQLKIMEHNK